MGRISKPVTIASNASDGGLLCRWGSFGLQELARFGNLLEKPVRLKLGWPDNEDMTTLTILDTINSSENKLAGKDDALKAMVTALNEDINELKGELKIFKAAVGNGMLALKPK
ncbi:hypothetical protein J1N35_035696 [Gossypium stocksii]|uniref:Uncharacterized protein n=1 Tax=Gossypium stocksii TaxID=47602 RepID=A0A9D3UUF1_9ROSI|nr:hypothetical protein J1N35_035696 [Gossypium stocksii]